MNHYKLVQVTFVTVFTYVSKITRDINNHFTSVRVTPADLHPTSTTTVTSDVAVYDFRVRLQIPNVRSVGNQRHIVTTADKLEIKALFTSTQ